MWRRKKRMFIFLIVVAVFFLIIIFGKILKAKQENKTFSSKYIMAEEIPELLRFTHYDTEIWKERLKFVHEKLNYRKLEELLEYLSIEEYVTYEKKVGFQLIHREEFFQIYQQILEILDVENQVEKKNLIFLQEKNQGEWLTQEGTFSTHFMEDRNCFFKEFQTYQVYCIQGEIIGVRKPYEDSLRWKNVFVHQMKDGKIQILYENQLISWEIGELEENIQNTICDFLWENNTIKTIYKKQDTISGKILSYNEKEMEISGYGTLEYEKNWKIYKTYGTLEQVDKTKLIIGNLNVNVVVANGKVCGMILKEPGKYQKIRVLLLKEEQPYHEEIYLVSKKEMKLEFGDRQKIIPAKVLVKVSEVWKDSKKDYLKISLVTEQEQDFSHEEQEIFLANEKGEPISLGYQGILEIRKYPQGYGIVNELPIEDYLCSVVPSEMPASYHEEALKTQAVCARSYAYIQLENHTYASFAANVDDSTNYQVYNKQPRNQVTTRAVKDTAGEVLAYKDSIVEAYYYSTSCGFSQSMDVWNLTDTEKYGYLQSMSLLQQENHLDLSKEEDFQEFIKQENLKSYESEAPYFRWQAGIDLNENLSKINQIILERQKVNEENVQIFDETGTIVEKNPEELGALQKIKPKERSRGGVLKSVQLEYEKGSIILKTEYNIRRVLSSVVLYLTDCHGKQMTPTSLLPSAAFAIISTEEGLVLYGGGYGHGIGMSQNGANGMAKEGLSYVEILEKFYHQVKIQNVYEK